MGSYLRDTCEEIEQEEFGINVHALVTVRDIYEFLKENEDVRNSFGIDVLGAMEKYMEKYCI